MAITLANYNATLEFDASKFQKGMQDSSKQFDDFAKNAQSKAESLGKTIKNALNIASGAALGAGVFSVKQASEFETSLHKLSTIADTSKVSMDDFGDSLKNLSNETGQSASSLANVAYNAISAGTDTENAMEMVETATKLAVGGFTDAESALSVLTTAQNAYGDSAGSVKDISDSLITTQNKGCTTVGELSSSIGKAIAMGSGYGVSLSNIESAYISMTKQGISTAEGTTYLNSMVKELGNSGSDVAGILKDKTGKSFGQLMQDGMSLGDVIKILMDSCDGNSEAFKQLWSSAEGGMAASAIVNEGLDTFNENLIELQNSSGATEEAYTTMSDTFEFKANQLKQNVSNLGITIGNELLPHITNVVEKVTDWINKFSEMDDSTKQMIIQVGGFVAVLAPLLTVITKVGGTAVKFVQLGQSISGMITAAGGIPAIMAQVGATIGSVALPIVGVIAVIGALVGAFVHLWNTNEDFRNKITEIWTSIKTTFENFTTEIKTKLESVGITFDSVTTTIKNIWQGFCDFMAPVFEGAFQNLSIILETVFGVLSGILSVFIGVFTGDWSQAWDGVKQVFDSVWNGIKSFFRNAINTIKNIAKVFTGWFGGDWKKTFTNVKTTTSTIFGGVKTIISNALNVCKNTVKNAFTTVKTTVSNATNAVKTAVSNGWTTVKNKISTTGSAIKTNVSNTFNAVKTKVSTVTSSIKQSASTGWTNLKNSVTKTVGNMKTGVQTTFGNLRTAIANNITNTRTSATNGYNQMKASLVASANGLKTSVTSTFNLLKTSVTTAVIGAKSTAMSTFNAMSNSLKSMAQSAKSSIVSSFNSIKSGVSSAMSSAKHKALSAWSGISSKFHSVGKNIISGIKSGISSAAGSLYDKLKNLARNALQAAKNAIGIHSPSKAFKEDVGVNIVKGIIEGVDSQKKNAKKSAEQLANLYYDATKKEVEKQRKQNKLTITEEMKVWNALLKETKAGSAAYLNTTLQLIRLRAKRNQQSAKQAENEKKQIEQNAKIYLETAQDNLKTLKKNGKITEAQEITFWKRISDAVKNGTKQYKTAQEEMKKAKKALKDDVTSLTSNFAKDVQKIESTLDTNIKNLRSKYSQAVSDRKNEIMGKTGVTDSVKISETYLTKNRLKYNLKNQVNAYKEWSDTLTKLEKRIGANSPLIKELRGMGVEQTNTLKAINSMNAKELKSYISLYNKKAKIASERSKAENATLLKDTEKQIATLQKNAKKQVEDLTKTYSDNLRKLGVYGYKASSDIGKQIVSGISAGLKSGEKGMSSTMKKMINNLVASVKKQLKIKSPSGVFRDEVGQFIPLGISEGIDNDKSVVMSMQKLGDDAIDAINSKSGVKLDALMSDASLDLKGAFSNGLSALAQATTGLLANAVTSGGNAIRSIPNVVINMGDISVSGVLDKDASEQVRMIADEQVAQFDEALAGVIPVGGM